MRRITVSPNKLILDPNNPRLISRSDDRVKDEDVGDAGIIQRTAEKMKGGVKDAFRIKDLERSIERNGWQPVDSIFVRKHGETDQFIVLEGNRRVTAISNLLNKDELDPRIRSEIADIEVMEILDTGLGREELEEKISYLLGVRHHGSLKSWSPFAQAHNIYLQYKASSGQTDDSFNWSATHGDRIAGTLGVKPEIVKERLKVYRSMLQIGNTSVVKESEGSGGGMKDRYYSVCQEVLVGRSKKLGEYIRQDPDTFTLDDEAVQRMNNLCNFNVNGRHDAPINNPAQWRYLDKILSDEDEEKRSRMISEVEDEKKRPDAVWAHRAEELRRLQWDRWFQKVALVLGGVTLGNIQSSEEESEVIGRLVSLLDCLDATRAGGNNA